MKRSSPTLGLILAVLAGLWSGCEKSGEETGKILPDTLQVIEAAIGQGRAVVAGDYLTVHYSGWLYVDGQKGELVDSSRQADQPFSFRLGRGRVIQGWDQGLPGMKVGGRRTLIVPPDLAYGQSGLRQIPPGSTLLYEVELISAPTVGFETLVPGDGPLAEEGDMIKVAYTGWLAEEGRKGRQFDSTAERGHSLQITLGAGHVYPGLDLGLDRMRVGGKRLLTIPPELGYGLRGYERDGRYVIPPEATLLVEVELLEVVGKH